MTPLAAEMMEVAAPVLRRRNALNPESPHSTPYHEPVLLGETLALLAPAPGKLFLDGTLGGGGHTEAFLKAGAQVIGLDQDWRLILAARYAGARIQFSIRWSAGYADEPGCAVERGGSG